MDGSLVERLLAHQEWVRRLAAHLTESPQGAEDVAQESWVRALERPPAHTLHLRAWLTRVVRSVVRERDRSERRREARERGLPPPARREGPDEIAARVQLQQEMVQALMALPRGQRDVLLLRFFDDCTTSETARRLGVAPGTVESRQHRALAALRARLTERHGSEGWLPLLAAWVQPREGMAAAAAASTGVLMASLTIKVAAATAAVALAGTGWWMLHDPFAGAAQVPESEKITVASADVAEAGPAARRAPSSPTAEGAARGGDAATARGLTLTVLADGSPAAAGLILYDDSFHLGPAPTDEQGAAAFDPPPEASGAAWALVLPEIGLPELHEVPELTGSQTLALDRGPAALRGVVLVNGTTPAEPVTLHLVSHTEPWPAELPAEIQRLAELPVRSRPQQIPVLTDAHGRFEVLGLPEGWRGRLLATRLHQMVGPTGGDSNHGIELDGPAENLVVHLNELPSVRGQVVDEATGQPLEDLTGDCFVRFQDGDNSPSIGLRTERDGLFRIAIHSSSSGAIDYGNRELWPTFERIWISLERGAMKQTFEFEARKLEVRGDVGVLKVAAGRQLEFRVVDCRGDPIEGAAAFAGRMSTRTDASGCGRFQHLPAEVESVTVGALGFGTATQPLEEPLVVELPDANTLTVKVHGRAPVPENLSLWIQSEPGLFPDDDRARALRYGLLWEGNFLSASWMTSTDVRLQVPASGELVLQELAPGQDLVLELRDPLAGLLASVAVPGLGEEEHRTVEIGSDREPWFLCGEVVDAAGAPAAGVRVIYHSGRGETFVPTDGDGRFRLGPLLVAGGIAGTVVAKGESAASDPRSVHAGDPSPVRLELRNQVSLKAVVLDEEGRPVPVDSASVAWPGDDGSSGTMTAANAFVFRGLPAGGPATVRARIGGRWYERPCYTTDGECELRVPVHGTLRVQTAGSSPPDQRTVRVVAIDPEDGTRCDFPLGFGDDGTRAATQALLPGTYVLELGFPFEHDANRPPPQELEVVAGEVVVATVKLPAPPP